VTVIDIIILTLYPVIYYNCN